MNSKLFLYFTLIWMTLPTSPNAQPDTLLQFLAPFVGEWYGVPDSATLRNFPEMASSIGFKFEWAHENRKMMRFYEGIPDGNMEKRILESLVAVNPRTGSVEWLGFQMRDDLLFQGRFEPLTGEKGFVRLYDVYYPPETSFRQKADQRKGMKSYRDICRLTGPDTLECTTEQLDFGLWQPWGQGQPFRMVKTADANAAIPRWLFDDWANRTQGSGIWITDNAAYKSDQEPYDAYGLHWEYGLGKKHLKGRLFCIQNGKDVGSIWHFTEYWDPERRQVRVLQIGSDGTVGQGQIWPEEGGRTREQQQFVSPGGGSFWSGHLAWMENGAQYTQSYNIVDGKWEKRRLYIWKLQEPTGTSGSERP